MIAWLLLITLPLLPDARLTPGDIATLNTNQVCTAGYAATQRVALTERVKLTVYRTYGVTPAGRFGVSAAGTRVWKSDFEVDHLVSLELGGSNAPANLWPQSYRTRTWNAISKDALENRLHWLVCHHRLRLAVAQDAIRVNWIDAYRTFITNGPPK